MYQTTNSASSKAEAVFLDRLFREPWHLKNTGELQLILNPPIQ
jgi:hypothetical protein